MAAGMCALGSLSREKAENSLVSKSARKSAWRLLGPEGLRGWQAVAGLEAIGAVLDQEPAPSDDFLQQTWTN